MKRITAIASAMVVLCLACAEIKSPQTIDFHPSPATATEVAQKGAGSDIQPKKVMTEETEPQNITPEATMTVETETPDATHEETPVAYHTFNPLIYGSNAQRISAAIS